MPPTHPGELVRKLFISAGNTVSDLADQLGFTRNTLNRLINGHASISVGMALALESICLHSAEYWLDQQQEYDLYNARLYYVPHVQL